jgi:hypothetical protein
MAAQILALLPGMDYASVMDMTWTELSFWHKKAVETAKILRGVE